MSHLKAIEGGKREPKIFPDEGETFSNLLTPETPEEFVARAAEGIRSVQRQLAAEVRRSEFRIVRDGDALVAGTDDARAAR